MYIPHSTQTVDHYTCLPEVYLASVVIAVGDKSLELFIDHVDHSREGKLPWEGRLGQLTILIGEDL